MKKDKNKSSVFEHTVEQIVDAIGGPENIEQAFHCATRFRIVAKDETKVDKAKLETIDQAKGWSKEGKQWQIIFGAGLVDKVFDKYALIYLSKELNQTSQTKKEKLKWEPNYAIKTNLFLFIRTGIRNFADIFIPLIPIFIVGGLSLALNSFINIPGIGKTQVADNLVWMNKAAEIFSKLFDTVGGAILGSLPVFVGFTAAKKWGANPFLGAAMGLILVAPGLVNSYNLGSKPVEFYSIFDGHANDDSINWIPVLWAGSPRVFDIQYPIFGIPLMGYQAQIIPTLMVILVMSYIEKGMKRISHEAIAIISVPLVSIIATTILAFVIIGPLGYVISFAIAEALKGVFIYTNFPGFGLGGAILGAIYAPIVVTGLHQGFLPIETQLIANYGQTWITPIATVSNVSQAFACLGAMIYIKNKQKKSVAASGALSANLGITEPAMFGININISHFFVAGIIGSAVGGYWLGMTQTTANSVGSASWIGLIQFDVARGGENLTKWYDSVAAATPWGKYMDGFGLAPIANVAIAMTFASLVSFSMANVLSWTKMGRENLQAVNGDQNMPQFLLNLQAKAKLKQKANPKGKVIYAPIDGKISLDPAHPNQFKITTEQMNYAIMPAFAGIITTISANGQEITISNKKQNHLKMQLGLNDISQNEVQNLRQLKHLKFHKFVLSRTYQKSFIPVVKVNNNLLSDLSQAIKEITISIDLDSIKANQELVLIATDGQELKKGQPVYKIIDKN